MIKYIPRCTLVITVNLVPGITAAISCCSTKLLRVKITELKKTSLYKTHRIYQFIFPH